MEIAETLEALCKAEGVSGAESAACKAALDILKKHFYHAIRERD